MLFAHSFLPSSDPVLFGDGCSSSRGVFGPVIDAVCVRSPAPPRLFVLHSAAQTLFSIFIFLLSSANQTKTNTFSTYFRMSRLLRGPTYMRPAAL